MRPLRGAGDRLQIEPRVGQRHRRADPSHHRQEVLRALLQERGGLRKRPPGIRVAHRKRKPARHDADDLVRRLAELNGAADDGGIGAEARLPRRVAEHQHAVARRHAVGLAERAAEHRRGLQRVEEVRRRDGHVRVERLGARRERRAAVDVGCELLERPRARAPVLVVRRRHRVARLEVDAIVFPHRHEAFGRGIRQRTDQDAVHHAEDGRRRADGEREREEDDGGVGRTPREQADGVANVLAQHVEAPLLTEEAPRVGDGADRAGERRIGGELRLPLGAELAPRGAGRESRDHRDEAAEEIRHAGCRG